MKKIIGIGILGIIIFFLVIGIARSRQQEEVLSISKIQYNEGIPVIVNAVEIADVSMTNRYYGDIKAADQFEITSRSMERIESIFVKVGDRIEKDQPLVRFDTTTSQTAIVQLRLAMENAQRDYERIRNLFEQGAISRQIFDGAKLQYDLALENYEIARRSIVLYAPSSGRIARIDFKPGDVVRSGDLVMMIFGSEHIEVEFDVTREDRSQLRKGQKISVAVEGVEPAVGEITYVSLVTNHDSRMFKIYARVPASKHLFPGVLASIDVTIEARHGVMTVPQDALLNQQDDTQVVAVNKGKAEKRSVKVGLRGENRVEILSGLSVGELVGVYGHKDLEDGDKVKVVKE